MKPALSIRSFESAARGPLAFAAVLAAVFSGYAADPFAENVRTTPWLSPAGEQKTFHLPPGFAIQLVASEPDILKPMNMAFDEKGRLWVTVTQEYPHPAPTNRVGRDAIKILEDTDGDGRADRITTFADGLNIPIGIYPFYSAALKPALNGSKVEALKRDSAADSGTVDPSTLQPFNPSTNPPPTWKAVVWSIPHIWLMEDTDADGRADKREVLFGPFDHTRDTHGNLASFRRGFDGWLYATHGYNNQSTVRGRDSHEIRLHSGNTFRLRLDGSRVEQHTWGQVNPFGLAFDPLGNLFSADCHSQPIYQLLAGGYYPSFGKPHDGLGFAPTMMEKPRGSTALCGIVAYADELWPEEYRGNILIGDVLSCRIFRDRLVEHGATSLARAMPDFLSADDPWFRPVDLQLGPDGALYVADFYNRIIGHYEVPLNHPGRDRTSGRIWRIVYQGRAGVSPAAPPAPLGWPRLDFSRAAPEELVAELAHPNITRRRLAMDQLTDRIGQAAVAVLQRTLARAPANPRQTVHGLWALQRLGALGETLLPQAAGSSDRAVRVHAMRLLAETRQLGPSLHKLALAGLTDSDPLVQRCAAEVLARHPSFDNIGPLLALRHRAPAEDTHLLYVARKALRDQLNVEEHFTRLASQELSEADADSVADVALGVKSPAAGLYLLEHAQKRSVERQRLAEFLRHAARYAPESSLDRLAQLSRAKFSADIDLQLSLLRSVQQGLDQRGAGPTPALKDWGAELGEKLLGSVEGGAPPWMYAPLESGVKPDNPWFLQKRASADGDKSGLFLCSLPPGGEELTGLLRSGPFVIPSQLTFWLAGHDGFPDRPAQKKNLVRLMLVAERGLQTAATPAATAGKEHSSTGRAAGGGGSGVNAALANQVIAEAFPPRNDTAQKVAWDTSAYAGKTGFIEVTDGDTGGAFAWLAVGRFDPPVVPMPALSPNLVSQRQQSAAELAAKLQLDPLAPRLSAIFRDGSTDAEVRVAMARALVNLQPKNPFAGLAPMLADAALPLALREQVGLALVEADAAAARAALAAALQTASHRAQARLAQALAGNPEGSETLFQSVADGKVSPHVLLDRGVKDKVVAGSPTDGPARIEQLTKGLAPLDEQIQKLVEQRRKAYHPGKALPAEGARIYAQNCAACHSIDGQGGNIGPQLDGIGQRGLERLCEDVLDPNRNVDRAFRSSLLSLKDGEVVSGLVRREEGELLVLADSTGKEVSFPKKDIMERRESEVSLMPENFGELLALEDFNHLMAFLLSKGPVARPGDKKP